MTFTGPVAAIKISERAFTKGSEGYFWGIKIKYKKTKEGDWSCEAIFIDGTKIESSRNRYTFVWKKAVSKNMQKLLQKAADLVEECEGTYGFHIVYGTHVRIRNLKKLRKKLYELKESEAVVFVKGIGKRKTQLQRHMERLEEYLTFKYLKIVADAGYESEQNYVFLEKNGQLVFIKPANYEISKTENYLQPSKARRFIKV